MPRLTNAAPSHVSSPRVKGLLGGDGLTGVVASYVERVLMMPGLIAYWPLWETAGVTARCLINPLQNGTYTGVTLGQPGIGDGNTCPFFDGVGDCVTIFSPTFAAALDGAAGTAMIWAKVNAAGVWADVTVRQTLYFRDNPYTNLMNIRKSGVNGELRWLYYAGGAAENKELGGNADTDWMCLALTWDKAGDAMIGYKDGANVVSSNTLGIWGGPITKAMLGVDFPAANPWHGWLAHCAVWDSILTQPQIAGLATV